MPRGGSQASLVVLIAGNEVKITGMVRSSLAAEVAAANVALVHGEFLCVLWAEVTTESFSHDWRLCAKCWPPYEVLGARTGFNALRGDTQFTDKRAAIYVATLPSEAPRPTPASSGGRARNTSTPSRSASKTPS